VRGHICFKYITEIENVNYCIINIVAKVGQGNFLRNKDLALYFSGESIGDVVCVGHSLLLANWLVCIAITSKLNKAA
jgi:hypothetical protein